MKEHSFGDVLYRLRKQNALTQKDLAAKLHIHITTIKNWESGSCFPDAKNICLIADLFHVTTDYLLGRDSKETVSLVTLSPKQRKLIHSIIQIVVSTIDE